MNEINQEAMMVFFMKFVQFSIEQRHASFIKWNNRAEKKGIVFVGDSITEMFNIHELLKSSKRLYNRGIGGDTTNGVLDKLKDLVFDLEPSKVFLMIGTNDLGNGKQPEEIIRNIEEICSRIKTKCPETELYVESIYPVNRHEHVNKAPAPTVFSRNNVDIGRINDAIQQLSISMQFTYVDVYSKLIDQEGHLNPDYTYDGLHLTGKGYEIVKDVLQSYL